MMNFLNNIWLALSTPNESLVKTLTMLFVFLEIPLTLYLIISIFNLQTTKKQNILYIITSAMLAILSLCCIPSPFHLAFNYITSFVITRIIFKTSYIKTIIAAVLPSFVFTIVQSLIFNPYITLLNITYEQLLNTAIYKLPLSLIIYSFVFLIAFILKHKKLYLNLLDEFDKKTKSIITLNLIFGLAYIIIELVITMKYVDILPLTYTFANFIMLLLYFVINLYSISRVTKLTNMTKKLESAEEYNKTLHILHDNVRGFKHDFDNIVTTIGGYINTNDMEGLKKYYIQLEKDCEKVNNLYILNPDSINNPRNI